MMIGDRFISGNTSGIIESFGTQSISWGTWIVDTHGINHIITESYEEITPVMQTDKRLSKPFYTQGSKKKGGRKSW